MTEDELEDEEIMESGIDAVVNSGPYEDPRTGAAGAVAEALMVSADEAKKLIENWETEGRIKLKPFTAHNISESSGTVRNKFEWQRIESTESE